ncbi:MAG: DUF3307 domain-containing protein [Chloroflexota bacterium]
MSTFFVLLLAHLLGDFPLQTNRIFRMKLASKRGLSLHIAIHVVTAAVLIESWWQHWVLLLVYAVVHFLTDYIKIRLQEPGKPLTVGFIWDQIAHVVAIAGFAWWQPNIQSILPPWVVIIAVFLAIFPAVMMLMWVWANDHYIEQRSISSNVEWISKKLLPISQRFGWGIMIALFLFGIIFN